jgi:hypothetical protein
MRIDWVTIDKELKNKRHLFWNLVMQAKRIVPSPFRNALYFSIASVAPDVPIDLRRLSTGSRGWTVFTYGFVLTFILCYVVTALLTVNAGTCDGSNPNVMYFRRDSHNLFFYLFVCPTYVGFCAWIIHLFLGRRHELALLADALESSPQPQNPGFKLSAHVRSWTRSFPVVLTLILAITVAMIYQYMSDILSVNNVRQEYWFMTQPINGRRYLNDVGVYYVVLNFCLGLATVTAIFCFFSLFFETLRVGDGVRAANGFELSFEDLSRRLSVFTEAYLVAKLLCAAYIVNVVLWKISPLGKTQNVDAAFVAVASMGLFFISFPRYYIELMWRDHERKFNLNSDLKDIRKPHQRVLANLVDTFFISAFVLKYKSVTSEEKLTDAINELLLEFLKVLGVMN